MRPAQYAVIRYIADPGRNEALNIGIVVWDDQAYRLRIDEEAIKRVIRENCHLAKDALRSLEPSLRGRLAQPTPFNAREFQQSLEGQAGFPMLITEPRFTQVAEDRPEPLDTTLDRLIRRIVRPQCRRESPCCNSEGMNTATNILENLQPEDIVARLDELERETKALRVLLRAARARRRSADRVRPIDPDPDDPERE